MVGDMAMLTKEEAAARCRHCACSDAGKKAAGAIVDGHTFADAEQMENAYIDICAAIADGEERGAARERAAVVAVLSAEVSRLESFRKTPFGEGSHAGVRRMLGVIERLEHLKPCAESQGQDAPTSPKG